jgi:hypothetical protein
MVKFTLKPRNIRENLRKLVLASVIVSFITSQTGLVSANNRENLVSYLDEAPVTANTGSRLDISSEYAQISDSSGDTFYLDESCGNIDILDDVDLENIELEPINYDLLPVESIGGEVLGAETTSDELSPVDAGCKGLDWNGDRVSLCGGGGTEVGFIGGGSGDSIRYHEDCEVKLVYGSMPAFFKGIDRDPKDGRIDTFKACEFPDISNVAGSVLAAEKQGDDIVPGDGIKRAELRFMAPDPDRSSRYSEDVVQATDISFNVTASTEGGETEIVGGLDDDVQHSKTYDCEFWYDDPSQHCESSAAQGAQANEGMHNFLKPPAASRGAALRANDTCPSDYDQARYRVLCLDLKGILEGWIVRMRGNVPKGRCEVDEALGVDLLCKRTVSLTVYVKDLFDARIEEHSDFLVQASRSPDGSGSTDSVTSYAEFPDEYVATPGVCSVCGQYAKCMIVWRDYRREHWERAKSEVQPMDCSDPAVKAKYPCCDYETYKKRVEDASGGVDPSFVPI